MIYRAIGVMSGSSLDGLDLAFVQFDEQGGKWNFDMLATACYPYDDDWRTKLQNAIQLNAAEYELLNYKYGEFIGKKVNQFIKENQLQYKVGLVASHGHTSFHMPSERMTAQLGHGAAIAAQVRLPVVTELRAMDVALGGQGAPIVPIGEKLLLQGYSYFMNIGGIANISAWAGDKIFAFDICPANRVLNLLAADARAPYDDGGKIASTGNIDQLLLNQLNNQPYYAQPFPKSLSNDMGTDILYPLCHDTRITTNDALRTYTEHIAIQTRRALALLGHEGKNNSKMLITGGGAFNNFLVSRIREVLAPLNVQVEVPEASLVNFKEAMVMAFIGVLRWRQESNVLSSVTGAERDSIGGALWIGEG